MDHIADVLYARDTAASEEGPHHDRRHARADRHRRASAPIMPDAPGRRHLLGQHPRPAATASATCRPTAGTPSCTTTRTRTPRTRPTRASAAGSASSTGIRWRGGCRSRRRSASQMDDGQKWAVAAARAALLDAGWPDWTVDPERVAVIIGNAIGGEKHYRHEPADRVRRASHARCGPAPSFAALPDGSAPPCSTRPGNRSSPASPVSPRTRCRASWPTSSPAGSPTCSTSAAPTSPPTPPARPGSPRLTAAVRGLQAARLRRGGHRRRRPQHGRGGVREVLQDRRAVGDRHAAVRRGRRRLRHGRGRGAVRAQAPRRRRARRRPDLRGRCWASAAPATAGARASPPRTRSGSGWPSSAPGTTPASTRRSASYVEAHGTSTRVGDATELASLTEVFGKAGAAAGLDRARLGQVQHRPPQGRGRRRRAVQDGHEPARQGAAAEPALRRSPTRTSTGTQTPFRVNTRAARVAGAAARRCAVARGERVRLRRHQLPRRAGGVRARPAPEPRRRRIRSPSDGRSFSRSAVDHGSVVDRRRRRCAAPPSSAAATRPTWPRSSTASGPRRGPDAPPRRPHPTRRSPAPRSGSPSTTPTPPSSRPRPARASQALRGRQPGDVADAARAGRVPRPRAGAEGRVPLHRAGLAVRQHAARPARPRADRGRRLRRGRPDHDAAARPAADGVHLRRRRRRRPPRGGSNSSCCRPRSPSRRC